LGDSRGIWMINMDILVIMRYLGDNRGILVMTELSGENKGMWIMFKGLFG